MKNSTEKSHDPIRFSHRLMNDNIKHRKMVCATIVERGTLNVDYLAGEISRSTTVTETDVKAVLTAFVEFAMEHLASGYRLNFGDFGQFFPTLKATSTRTLEECDESTIKQVRCHFRPSIKLKNLLNQVSFEYTLPPERGRQDKKKLEAGMEYELYEQEKQ